MYCVHTDGRVNDEVGDGGRLEAVVVTQGKEGHRCGMNERSGLQSSQRWQVQETARRRVIGDER